MSDDPAEAYAWTNWPAIHRTRQPRLTVADTESGEWANRASQWQLIDPYDAAVIFANGGHVAPPHPARSYDRYTAEYLATDQFIATTAGRLDLAMELIGDAIAAGTLRCAFPLQTGALPYPNNDLFHARLEVIDPVKLAALEPDVQWEDGCTVLVDRDGQNWEASGFYLLWDEVVALRPSIGSTTPPMDEMDQGPTVVPATRPTTVRRKPPRRSKEHGAAIARFTLDLLDMSCCRSHGHQVRLHALAARSPWG